MQLFLTCASVMATSQNQKAYVTDMERDLTFFGSVKSLTEHNGILTICMSEVTVYEYSSSNYLYQEVEISFSRPKSVIHIEEA
ncbi:hypothetical protein PQ469_16590 [Mucilaginibacter sp. KACC 22773]|uniref:hypothetical protein n=1 Tax=Mucilaginibacter sp. KACC 22773 TaxID=3025671 RepID=UPI002366A282|nr:hypothetical protein [Mucilaginibacter sp. KACC 22773]WDF75509.1 hypothetical protein PQ469_16590 [Mucilaginibacter sp. KACC 22773]